MTHEYLGVVIKELPSGGGELRGLARFQKGRPDPDFDPTEHFESDDGHVFVPELPKALKRGAPVTFHAEKNLYPKGRLRCWVPPPNVKSGRLRLELHGFAILGAAEWVIDSDAVPLVLRPGRILPDGMLLYLRCDTEDGIRLRGPWTVKGGSLTLM